MTTEKQLRERFEEVMAFLKLPTSSKRGTKDTYYSRPFYHLDFAPQYGGYIISLVGTNTAHYTAFTDNRMPAKEMKRFLDGLAYGKVIQSEYKAHKETYK